MPDISGEYAGHWWRRFWWMRGVIAALTLTSVIPNFVDLSRFDFLKGFHLIVVGWDDLMALAGELIGKIPYIPEIPAVYMQAITFTLAFGPPIAVGAQRTNQAVRAEFRKMGLPARLKRLEKTNRLRRFLDKIDHIAKSKYRWTLSAYVMTSHLFMMVVASVVLPLTVVLAPQLLGELGFFEGNSFQRGMIVVGYGVYLYAMTLFLMQVPGFLRGMLYFLTFTLTLELLYFANTPGLKPWIDIKHCELTEDDPSICQYLETS